MKYSRRDFEIAEAVIRGRTLQDVGTEYVISRQRVQQILDKVLKGTFEEYPDYHKYLNGYRAYRKDPMKTIELIKMFHKKRPEAIL